MEKYYPDSGIELSEFTAKNYDKVMNIASFGKYKKFIYRAISDMDIKKNDKILDLGCGTGRNIKLMNNYVSDDSLLEGEKGRKAVGSWQKEENNRAKER